MAWIVDEARLMGVRQVGLSHVPENTEAGAFYERLGFSYSGQVIDGERVMALPLAAAAMEQA
jgi:RimJ/RimL family protein N-acetyltransferase